MSKFSNAWLRLWKGVYRREYVFYLLVAVCYYSFLRLYIPTGDDINYSQYMYADPASGRYDESIVRPIESLRDAIETQCSDYMYRNGRFLVHTLTQYFCGIAGARAVFFLLTSLALPLLLMGFVRLTRKGNGGSSDKYCLLALLLLLWPDVARVMWGNNAFIMNYVWPSVAGIWTLVFFRMLTQGLVSRTGKVGMVLFALIAGSLQESFSIPIGAALFFYALFHLRTMGRTLWVFCCAYWLGTSVCVFAPANFLRASGSAALLEARGYVGWVAWLRVVVALCKSYLVQVFILFHLFMWWKDGCRTVWSFVCENWLPYTCIFISVAFMVFVAITGAYNMTWMSLMMVLIYMRYLNRYDLFRTRSVWVKSISVLWMLLIYGSIYPVNVEAHRVYWIYKQRVEQAEPPVVPELSHALKRYNSAWYKRFSKLGDAAVCNRVIPASYAMLEKAYTDTRHPLRGEFRWLDDYDAYLYVGDAQSFDPRIPICIERTPSVYNKVVSMVKRWIGYPDEQSVEHVVIDKFLPVFQYEGKVYVLLYRWTYQSFEKAYWMKAEAIAANESEQ